MRQFVYKATRNDNVVELYTFRSRCIGAGQRANKCAQHEGQVAMKNCTPILQDKVPTPAD